VIGCGRGHEAVLFARHGFATTGFDFAPSAIAEARETAGEAEVAVEFVQADIFALPPRYAGQFDLVVERACFTAIDPARRGEYVQSVRSLLRPRGELIGVFLDHDQPSGPPFGTSAAELRRLVAGFFEVEQLESPPRSTENWRGRELFGRFRRV
jgi:SAM-dependent methyltransferase